MAESEPRKRRGRPRVSEEEKKRHTLTFRMRSDLRDAVEELAVANGRTLSEQVEYYVDAAVFTEAGLIYQYSTEAMSPTLFKCVSNRNSNQDAKSIVHLNISFPSEHREMLTIAGKNYLNNPETPGFLPWVKGPGGREGAVAMVRAMLAATRDGTIKAMVDAVGSEAVKAALDEEARAKKSASSQPQQTAMKPDLLANVSSCTLEANGSIDESCRRNFSIDALRQLLDRSKDNPQDLVAIRSAGWPQRFEELPADTRAKLIGDLQQGAAPAYQALMSSKGSRGEALEAFRRLQRALLPREPADEGDDEWPDEGPSHNPDAAAIGRPVPHR